MNYTEKHREFSMKYCAGLDEHVVVMDTVQGGVKSTLCLSSHLCQADERKRCGQDGQMKEILERSYIKM